MAMPGAAAEQKVEKDHTDMAKKHASAALKEVERKEELEGLEVLAAMSQVVAGTNYFLKITTKALAEKDDVLHVRIFKALPHAGGGTELKKAKIMKKNDK